MTELERLAKRASEIRAQHRGLTAVGQAAEGEVREVRDARRRAEEAAARAPAAADREQRSSPRMPATRRRLLALLTSPTGLQHAILVKEVLDRPIALRDDGPGL